MSNFNRALFGRNIKYLAEQKNIKIGSLEEGAGVSAGYFSRLANEEGRVSGSSSIIDAVCIAAKLLNVSVNTLISTDLAALTPNEKFLSKFFEKVEKDSLQEVIHWDCQTRERLDDVAFQNQHPLFCKRIYDYDGISCLNQNVAISDDCYKTSIMGKDFYLMKIMNSKSNSSGYELYFSSDEKNDFVVEQVCAVDEKSRLYAQVDDLYTVAADSSSLVKLSYSVKSTIQDYINTDENDFSAKHSGHSADTHVVGDYYNLERDVK